MRLATAPSPLAGRVRNSFAAAAVAAALGGLCSHRPAIAQAPAAASGSTLLRGTIRAADAGSITLSTDTGQTTTVAVPAAVRVQQLSPGSTDLKTAQAATPADIAVGDRVLVSARSGEGATVVASRIILMKSGDIAQRNLAAQADWRRRGSGGIVTAVDPAAGTVSITSGPQKETLTAAGSTIVRRYAAGSVRYEDSKPSTLTAIHAGDQLRVRGDRSADRATIRADEIVFGAFRTLTGTLSSVNTSAGTLLLKDAGTKKETAISITAISDLRELPPEMAENLASAAHGQKTDRGGAKAETTATAPAENSPAGAAASTDHPRRNDLSDRLPTLPQTSLSALKPGVALMVVASAASDDPGSALTAITVLSGVEPLLAAARQGGQAPTLSPWNLGSGDTGPATP